MSDKEKNERQPKNFKGPFTGDVEVDLALTAIGATFMTLVVCFALPAAGPAVFLGFGWGQIGILSLGIISTTPLLAAVGYATNAFGIRDFFKSAYKSIFGTADLSEQKQANLSDAAVALQSAPALDLQPTDISSVVRHDELANNGSVDVEIAPEIVVSFKQVYLAPDQAKFCVVKGCVEQDQFFVETNQNEGQLHLLMAKCMSSENESEGAANQFYVVQPWLNDQTIALVSKTGFDIKIGPEGKLAHLPVDSVLVVGKDANGIPQVTMGKIKKANGDTAIKLLENSENIALINPQTYSNSQMDTSISPAITPSSLIEKTIETAALSGYSSYQIR